MGEVICDWAARPRQPFDTLRCLKYLVRRFIGATFFRDDDFLLHCNATVTCKGPKRP
jgi:hypothetical protein